MRRWAICLYWLAVGVALGHMFQLYVCMCICVCVCMCICMCVYMFQLYVCMCICVCVCMCICMCVYICVCMCVCMCVYMCVFIGLPHHREGTCWRYISSSNKLKLKCTLSKLCVNESYTAASGRFELTTLQLHSIYLPMF